MAIILSETDLARLYKTPAAMDELMKAIEDSLCAHSRSQVAGQARVETSLTDPTRKYRIMTAAVPAAGFGIRVNALFTAAKDAYFHLLFDNERGDLLALISGRGLNTWRTGAPSGVATRYLAPSEVKKVGLLGSGRQARTQLLALCRALPSLRDVRVFSPTKEHRVTFAKENSHWLGVDIKPVDSAREAVQDAAIVGVATASRAPVLDTNWIPPGALLISITSGQLPEDLIAGARVIVSWKEEVLAGEAPRQPYAAMIAEGKWSGNNIAGELGDVILGKIPGREDGSTTVFECVGMPIWDTAASAWAYRWAKEQGIGTSFALD